MDKNDIGLNWELRAWDFLSSEYPLLTREDFELWKAMYDLIKASGEYARICEES